MKSKTKIPFVLGIIFFLFLSTSNIANEPYAPFHATYSSKNYFSVYLMDQGQGNVKDFSAMLLYYNPKLEIKLADSLSKIYISEAKKEGVNQDIAFIQMCLETGFLTYNGNVKAHQNNFAGLGAVNKKESGEHFPDIRTGVRAHIQHLKAYGSKHELKENLVDVRFRFVKRGSAQTIYDLSGKWASDKEYAKKLENLLSRLFLFKIQNNFLESLNI